MSKNKSLLTMLTEQLDKKPSKPKAPKQQLMDESNPFYIAKSDIAGKGAFASQYIPKGSMVDMLHQINQPGVDYDFTQLGRNYNHSDAPNTKNKLVGNKRFMVATEDIMPGQELTGDYRMQPDLEQPQPNWNTETDHPMMANGGYTVTRSSDRKGKTHKVTGPGGKIKYFGDSSMGQHPKDPERKAAFYARHKKNLDGNPFFRAFARATWQYGGETGIAYGDNTRVGNVPRYSRPMGRAPQSYDGFLKAADIATDVMQLGHFIPTPVTQGIALAGDFFGAGIDGYQALDEATRGNYGDAAINAASAFLPSVLKSKGYLRDMYNVTPGSTAAKIANLGSKDGSYRPLTALPRLMNNSAVKRGITANRSVAGALGAETWYDQHKDGGQTLGSGLLAKSINCKGCGHSWKSTDGGQDTLTCHNCGYVNDHMQQGGQSDEAMRSAMMQGLDKTLAYGMKGAKWIGKNVFGTDDIVPDVVKDYMFNTIRPVSYPTDMRQVVAEFTRSDKAKPTRDLQGDLSMDEEAWSHVLRRPTKNKYFVPSKYKPSTATDPSAEYYTLSPDVFDGERMKRIIDDSYFNRNKKVNKAGQEYVPMQTMEPFMRKQFMKDYKKYAQMDFDQTDPLANFQIYRGVDPKTKKKYLSISDTYDFGMESANEVIKPMNIYDRFYYATGGQSRDEREMVNGIADILSQVQDPQNRAQIAANMMQDFKREKVTYNPDKFMEMSKLQNGGGWLDNYQEGGETDEAPAEYTGSSIVDYLQTKGFSGSKKFRKQLAEEMGVEGYNYSAKKNLELLNRLREEEELPEGYQPEFTPVPVDKIVQMERERGVYAPMPEQAAPQPRVVSAPVSNKFRIPMAGAPANPYAGMFDPRVALNNIPVSKAKPAAPAAKKPVASAPVNHYGIPMAPQQIPGLWNQQAAMERIKNYVPVPQPKRAAAAPVRKAAAKPVTKAEVAAQETEDENIFSGMFSGYNPTGMGPIMGSTMSPAAYEAVADDIQGLWDKATNWFERKTAMGDGKQERKASIDPKKIANDPIYVTGDTIPDKNGRYHIPEVMDLNYLKFGTRNRGDYTPIDTEAGSITAFKPFEPAKDYFAKNNDPANSTYMGVGPDGKIKVGGRKDFEGQDFKISKTFSNKVVDFNRNPDGSIVKVKSNPKASKETFSPSVKVMGEDGKIKDGKMSLLLPKDGNQEESFDLVTGGRYIMQTPDGKFKMVSGSLKNIEAEFTKLKKNNPYVNVITLDNGSYSRGIRTYDKNLSAKDLKKYDNQNTEGGNFAYLLPNAPKTRYDLKFNEFETTAKQRLQQLYPGKKVEVKFENEGLYDEHGSRDITSQADIQKKGYSQTPVSMHNFDAARDYALFVDGKKIPADKQKDLYKKVLWGAADKVGMYHLDDWDAVHIGLVKEGEKTGFNELYAKYPDIFATANTKKTKAFLEKNKNNPVYKEAYELLNNIKPFVPKTPKKQDGGNWLEKYN